MVGVSTTFAKRALIGRGAMISGVGIRLLSVGCLLASVTACSVADYKKPIGDFAKATENAETSLKGLDVEVTSAYAALIRRRVFAKELFVKIEQDDCLVESERCRVVVVDRASNEQLLSPAPALRKMIILMGSVRAYANGLSAIVNADAAAKLETQVNATVGSLKNLAGTVTKLGGKDTAASINLTEYATPVGQAVNWVVGQYIAKLQLDGLKRATADAKDVVAATADILELTAGEASRTPRAEFSEAVSVRVDALRDNLNETNLDKLIESADNYDQLLLGKPPAVFVRLNEAHAALADKLQNGDASLADVIAKIEAFAAEAETLAKIVKNLQAAGSKKGEG